MFRKDALFVSSLKAKFFSGLKALRCICFLSGPLQRGPISTIQTFFSACSHLCFTRMGKHTDIAKLESLYRAASLAIIGSLMFSHIPLLLEASLSLARHPDSFQFVILWADPLSFNFFFIPGLAQLTVKPRLSTSSQRVFTLTHPLMIYPSPREALSLLSFHLHLETRLSSACRSYYSMVLLWSSSFCSKCGSYSPDSLSLPSHNGVNWTNGFYPFGNGGSGFLADSSLCGIKAAFFSLASPACSSFSPKACAILHALH